jgi:hypothetical protein
LAFTSGKDVEGLLFHRGQSDSYALIVDAGETLKPIGIKGTGYFS